MRGGALPVFIWSCLLALLLAGNWIWTGDGIQAAEFGLATVLIVASALALTLASRESIRRGPPERPERIRLQTVPDLCLGALLVPVGIAATLFGVAFGHFAIYFGVALLLLAWGRVAIELRAERRTRERMQASPLADPERIERPQPAPRTEAERIGER